MSFKSRHVNLLHLEYLKEIVETGGISSAAKKMYVSQQAVSSTLAKLEKELDAKLFDREFGFRLTDVGEQVYKHAVKLIQQRDMLLKDVDMLCDDKETRVVFGCAPCRAQHIFPRVLDIGKQQFPELKIELVERNNTQELERDIVKGEISFAIGPFPENSGSLETVEFYRENLSLVVPADFLKKKYGEDYEQGKSLLCQNGANIEELLSFPFFLPRKENRNRQVFDQYLERRGIELPVVLDCDNIETLLSFAIRGQCITIFPELLLRKIVSEMLVAHQEEIIILPIKDEKTFTIESVAYRKGKQLSAADKKAIELFKQVCICTYVSRC